MFDFFLRFVTRLQAAKFVFFLLVFLPFETDRETLSSVFCTPAANCLLVILARLASARHISPAIV